MVLLRERIRPGIIDPAWRRRRRPPSGSDVFDPWPPHRRQRGTLRVRSTGFGRKGSYVYYESEPGRQSVAHSIGINDQWRICFGWPKSAPGPSNVEIVDYH